ncbi:MAG: flippase-like domain-containing protein, partial [Deltaproteobacteria bacterium]|nr:flippase-like domain-containing protein [Deltaproteobacteria bacterium]
MLSRKTIFIFLKTLLSIGLIAWLSFKLPFENVITLISKFNPSYFFLALLSSFISIVMMAKRWQILLEVLNFHLSLKDLTRFSFVSSFFNMFVPGGFAGDIMKSWMIPHRNGKTVEHYSNVGSSIILDKLMGLFSLTLASCFGLAFYFSKLDLYFLKLFCLLLFLILIFLIVILSRRIKEKCLGLLYKLFGRIASIDSIIQSV